MTGAVNPQLAPGSVVRTLPVDAPAPASSTTSTGTKVAVGAAAVAGVSILTVAVVSAVAGWTIQRTLDTAWDKLLGKRAPRR